MELENSLRYNTDGVELTFRALHANDVTDAYVSALKRQRSFLANNPKDIDIGWQRRYVARILASSTDTICGLFLGKGLIGTAGIQNVHEGQISTIGIFVLDPSVRGKGYGKLLVWSSCRLVSHVVDVGGFGAGASRDNAPSVKCFLACGFSIAEERDASVWLSLNTEDLIEPKEIQGVEVV